MCYSIYHPLDSEAALKHAEVFVERVRGMDGVKSVVEVFFSKVSGKNPGNF